MSLQSTLVAASTFAGAFILTAANALNTTLSNASLAEVNNGTHPEPNLRGPNDAAIGGISVGAAIAGAIIVGGIYCCAKTFCGPTAGKVAAAGATAGLIANAH
jgi:hypothetical protein